MQRTSVTIAGLSWDDVRLFLVLCRSRTMGEAASTLSVDTSTVSRRLVGLEAALDATLFSRGRDGLKATEAAEDLLPKAELVEHSIAEFANTADQLEREVSGLVRITCPPDAAEVVMLPVLTTLLSRYPGLRISLEPGEAVVDLNRRQADLALRVVRPQQGDLVVKRVTTVEWRPAATEEIAAKFSPLRDLEEPNWIGWSERYRSIPASQWLDAHVREEPFLRTDSLRTQIAAVKAGLGLALVPVPSIGHYGLTPLEIENEAADQQRPRDDLFLITHRALKEVPRVRAVWNAILENYREAS